MTTLRSFPAILLFGPGTAILPSRPVSAPPARTAEVKGGAAGACALARFTLDGSEHAGSTAPGRWYRAEGSGGARSAGLRSARQRTR